MAPAVTQLAHHARILISRGLDRRDEDAVKEQDEYKYDPHSGVTDTHDINNTAVFVIFGIIGAGIVCTGIWFFFWARNGGFYFKENDWEEYKSTVLRRKGPNGTLLSGATPSTNLGGGSVYKDFDDTTTVVTESTALSGITAGASDIAAREKREKKRRQKEKEREARRAEKKREKGRSGREEGGNLLEEDAEREAKHHLRSYRHEKPARVGGLNKESEASEWDGSTNPADSSVSSNLLSNREGTPTSSPNKHAGGIRKVYSTADRNAARESERIRAEARRLAERGRSAVSGEGGGYYGNHRSSRRDFSYQMAGSQMDESDVGLQRGGRIVEEESDVGGSDLGTRTYYHNTGRTLTHGVAESSVGSEYAEEKRRNRRERQGGYRRNRD